MARIDEFNPNTKEGGKNMMKFYWTEKEASFEAFRCGDCIILKMAACSGVSGFLKKVATNTHSAKLRTGPAGWMITTARVGISIQIIAFLTITLRCFCK